MKVLFYVPLNGGSRKRFRQEVEVLVSRKKRIVYRTIEHLSRRLREVRKDISVAVLLAVDLEDLFDLISIRSLLEDIKIILISPDREKNTVAMGHILHPRFLSNADSDFKDVAAVLEKMVGLMDSNNTIEA